MFHLSAEMRRRIDYASQSIVAAENTLDQLDRAGLTFDDPKLTEKYGDIAAGLRDVLGRLYVPNIRQIERPPEPSSIANIPRRYRDSDAIPFIPLRAEEMVIHGRGFRRANPRQQQALARQIARRDNLCDTGASIIVDSLMAARTTTLQSLLSDTGSHKNYAEVATTIARHQTAEAKYVWLQRPVIATYASLPAKSGATLLHEAMHVMQFEHYPLLEDGYFPRPRLELEALYVEHLPEQIPGATATEATAINLLRVMHNHDRPDTFEAGPMLQTSLRNLHLGGFLGLDKPS